VTADGTVRSSNAARLGTKRLFGGDEIRFLRCRPNVRSMNSEIKHFSISKHSFTSSPQIDPIRVMELERNGGDSHGRRVEQRMRLHPLDPHPSTHLPRNRICDGERENEVHRGWLSNGGTKFLRGCPASAQCELLVTVVPGTPCRGSSVWRTVAKLIGESALSHLIHLNAAMSKWAH
jgi:hypothetical protein